MMSLTNNAKREEVCKIVLSLLLARPGRTAVTLLDNDYYEAEGERIPWRKFGYGNLVEFLECMPEYFVVERHNNISYVRGIASDKSKHVSSLVSRQRSVKKYIPSFNRSNYRSNYYIPPMRQRTRIPAAQLNILVQYVRNYPNGVNIQSALMMIKKQLPHVILTTADIQEQLRELSHRLYLDGEIIRPVLNNVTCQNDTEKMPISQASPASARSWKDASQASYIIAGEESDMSDQNEDGFVKHRSSWSKTEERFGLTYEQGFNCYEDNDDVNSDYSLDMKTTELLRRNDASGLISPRIQSRLEQLMQKNPEGIWCPELPKKYLEEYKVPLNYTDLGFNSVREYVSYLPGIFYMKQYESTGDFMLYSTNKKPNEQETSTFYEQEIPKINLTEIPNSHKSDDDEDDAPIPADFPSSICAKFMPDNVMNYDESVGQILVTDLICSKRQYQEVYVIEVFNPSFFWIHLRGNTKHLEKFMQDLHMFYTENDKNYVIPRVALKRGLNCACKYGDVWHRGIIKSVKPDFKVIVMFYDYGTQKMYSADEIYYLHKQFSYLPAQAIPCGLYNVMPCNGYRWKKSITDRFYDKVWQNLLAATIMSVDPPNNSMLIILTDTSEENDVHINNWLVQENLAQYGKMVCKSFYQNFPFEHYASCNNIVFKPTETVEVEDVIVDVNGVKHGYCQLMPPYDKKMHELFEVESKSISENIKILHNVPNNKKINVQSVQDIKSAAKVYLPNNDSRSKNSSVEPRGPRELVALFEKLKALKAASFGVNATVSSSEISRNSRDNTRSTDLNAKMNIVESQNDADDDLWKVKAKMKFISRDSDDEENNKSNSFGLQSLYGTRRKLEPYDWSIIRSSNSLHTISSNNNLDVVKTCKSNSDAKEEFVKSDKFFHTEENKLIAKQCFLNLTRKEDEYFLAESNIDYSIKNANQAVARLKNRTKIPNDKLTTVVVKRDLFETLYKQVKTQDAPNSNTNTNSNSTTLPTETAFQEAPNEIDSKDKIIETCDKNNEDRSAVKCIVTNSEKFEKHPDASDKIFKPKYKMLLEQMKRMQLLRSNFDSNLKESSSSEQIPSSSSTRSYSSVDTMISSDDEQSEKFVKPKATTRFDMISNCLSKQESSTLTSSNELELSIEKIGKDSANAAANVDSRPHQPHTSKVLQHVLRMQQSMANNSELDSDDLSDENSCNDKKANELMNNDIAVTSDSINNGDINVDEEAVAPLVFKDYDTESDENEWDVCGDFEHFPFFDPQTKVQITEILKNESENLKHISQDNSIMD